MLVVTISGSFHRHLGAIYDAVSEFLEAGVKVLSPADPRVVDHLGEFLLLASDRFRSIRLVQDRHLQCIRASSLLWLVDPDGYVGQSASLEVGYAIAAGTPVYSRNLPTDATLQEYVRVVADVSEAISLAKTTKSQTKSRSVLVDPKEAIERCQDAIANVGRTMDHSWQHRSTLVERELESTKRLLFRTFCGR